MRELNTYESLLAKIQEKRAKIVVLGQGYIGLPLALLLCKAGYHVTGYDINKELIREIKNSKTRFSEPGVQNLLQECLSSGRYVPESRIEKALSNKDVYIIAVQTPMDSRGEPDLKYLLSALKTILPVIKERYSPILLVIESTIPPKTTEEIILSLLEKEGFFVGEDVFLAYCPERAMPGKLVDELLQGNRIIGVVDESSGKLATILYSSFTKGSINITHARTAEFVKLVENSYRDVNIAFANAIALACEVLGVDVSEVRKLANLHPRVNILRPGIGVGGSCLTKDPYFLIHSVKDRDVDLDIIQTARKLNEELPRHAAKLITKTIENHGKNPSKSVIAVLGIAYKGNVGDFRNSPVLKLIRELRTAGFKIRIFDPLVKELPSDLKEVCGSLEEAIKGVDCIVVGADHSIFLETDLNYIRGLCGINPIFFDGKHVFDRRVVERVGFEYLSVGCPENVIEILREIAEHHIY
ncbi:MAG TPA: nucleotide sugar dehydrogenase [Candidatus Korarchaeota archaeon]|nr:nucleotide sugar dehydrogenase [Candidatus Korarchaeota archaeon]